MKRNIWFPAALLLGICLCGPDTTRRALAVYDGDTLSVSSVADSLFPGVPEASMTQLLLQAVLARTGTGPASVDSTLIDEFVERLELKENVSVTARQARSLLASAFVLRWFWALEPAPDSLQRRIDSLWQTVTVLLPDDIDEQVSRLANCSPADSLSGDSLPETCFGCLLGVPSKSGRLLAEFVWSSGTEDTLAARDLIKDLVYRGKQGKPEKTRRRQRTFDSQRALAHRGQESVRAAIEHHQVNIKELYNSHLKRRESLRGSVVAEFIVLPSGSVESVNIVRSDIRDDRFLREFQKYCTTIAFTPIPENIGAMKFQFPFEFSPDA